MNNSSEPTKPKGRFVLWFFGVSLGSMFLGMVLTEAIPGCTVDTGRGASGCGAFGDLILLLAMGGFFLLMFTIIVVLPFWALLAILDQFRTRKNKS